MVYTKKVCTISYGCQMSERDAETLRAISVKDGYAPTEDLEDADLIIINTCCVRESAENKILGKIGQLKHLKKMNPNLRIAVAGCMVQQPGILQKLQKRAPHVDIWTGTYDHNQFSEMIHTAQSTAKISCVSDYFNTKEEIVPMAQQGKLKASVNIMYGCDNFCSYCIVPHVRGRERSRPKEHILQEISNLAGAGCKEITFLGQNVNSYGKKDCFSYDFADLLREADEIAGIERIRFMTSHPKDLSDKLIDTIARGNHLCEHFHLPFQSGSNRILQAMNRNYTREYYLDRVYRIFDQIPDARLSTDIIVGFPGEMEKDFEDTLDMVRSVQFSQAFTFIFSKRSGTKAAELVDQIPLDVKKYRLQKLMALQNDHNLVFRQEFVGKTFEVLVEGPSKTNSKQLTGRTRGNEVVVFSGNKQSIGELVNVRIDSVNSWTLFGTTI